MCRNQRDGNVLVVSLFPRQPEALETEEQEMLALLRSLHPEVDQTYVLVQQFAQMVHTHTGEQLDEWLCHVKESRSREFQYQICARSRARVKNRYAYAPNQATYL